jgi:hypothetical protein
MAYTFSVGAATVYYSQNKTDLLDVLQLLPDNTSKEITPQDVRDAVFSAWENTVFKYVNVNTANEYIGFSRDEIKGKKILFGKKQISGLDIMTSGLLSSDVDIFFYNTKSDSSLSQNFRATFLAGTNSNLFTNAPYIQATQISGASPYISLNLVNPATQGTINLVGGPSGSVIINNLYFPSTASVAASIANPSSSTTSDLFLALRGGQYLELLTYNFSGGSLGSPGSPTNIYGTPVSVNGYELEYTNSNPLITSIGGFTQGQTFSSVPIKLMFDQLLYPQQGPFATIQITTGLSTNNTLERNHTGGASIAISYTITKRTFNITSTARKAQRPDGTFPVNDNGSGLSGAGLITSSPTSYIFTIPGNSISASTQSGLFTFSVVPSGGVGNIFTASQTVEFVYPYITAWGTLDAVLTQVGIQQLFADAGTTRAKVINTYGSQSIPLVNPTTPRYLYFMYPSIYGTLSAIKDGNDFSESLTGGTWTYSYNVDVTDPSSSVWATNYNVYKKTVQSIISPSQIYKFIF